MWPNLKQKVRAVLPKPKLIVYIGRSQKSFQNGPQPYKKPFHFSIFNSEFSNFEFSNSEFSNSEFSNSEFSNFEFSNSEFLFPNFQIPKFEFLNSEFSNFEFSSSKFSNIKSSIVEISNCQIPNFQIMIFQIHEYSNSLSCGHWPSLWSDCYSNKIQIRAERSSVALLSHSLFSFDTTLIQSFF